MTGYVNYVFITKLVMNIIIYLSVLTLVMLERNLLARPNTDTFRRLMCSSDTQELFKIAKYCKIVLKTFQEIFRNI